MTTHAIEHALLAVTAMGGGDRTAAEAHLCRARQHARTSPRRGRQIVEIAALVVAGDRERAAGLALEHAAEFPDDAEVSLALQRGRDADPQKRLVGGA